MWKFCFEWQHLTWTKSGFSPHAFKHSLVALTNQVVDQATNSEPLIIQPLPDINDAIIGDNELWAGLQK